MKKYQGVYDRFGWSLDQKKVWEAFCKFIENEFWSELHPICNPNSCDEKYIDELDKISDEIHKKIARATCENRSSFYDNSIYKKKKIVELIDKLFYFSNLKENVEYIINLQIIFDEVFPYEILSSAYSNFVQVIQDYLNDFPQLGITLKTYKTKSAQIFPIISQATNDKINNTLNILEIKKYKKTVALFEAGMKEFISAKDIFGWKNIIEDMRGVCDEVVKESLNNNLKGMKSIFGQTEFKFFGLNTHSKKIFEEFMRLMDDIKHGKDDYTKKDVILIIGLTIDFIDFISSVEVNPK